MSCHDDVIGATPKPKRTNMTISACQFGRYKYTGKVYYQRSRWKGDNSAILGVQACEVINEWPSKVHRELFARQSQQPLATYSQMHSNCIATVTTRECGCVACTSMCVCQLGIGKYVQPPLHYGMQGMLGNTRPLYIYSTMLTTDICT